MIGASARASAKLLGGLAVVGTSSAVLLSKPIHNEGEGSTSNDSTQPKKLSIYPLPDPKYEVIPTQTELERQIGSARRSLASVTSETRSTLRSTVNNWIDVEKSIESEVKHLIPAQEPLTPGLLYVGVATLAGSIFTRYRAFPIRILTPPLALVASLRFFNPNLAHNLGQYYVELENKHFPALTRQRENLLGQGQKYLDQTTKSIHDIKDKTEHGVRSGLDKVEQQTGLKVGDVIAKKDEAKMAIKDQMKAV